MYDTLTQKLSSKLTLLRHFKVITCDNTYCTWGQWWLQLIALSRIVISSQKCDGKQSWNYLLNRFSFYISSVIFKRKSRQKKWLTNWKQNSYKQNLSRNTGHKYFKWNHSSELTSDTCGISWGWSFFKLESWKNAVGETMPL